MKVLITCPPMIQSLERWTHIFDENNVEYFIPEFTQTMLEDDLIEILPGFDGWIIGDDPATERVLESGSKGKLRVCVKWGVGVDNVDFNACEKYGIFITNTPNSFGEEVSDVAIGFLINLTRQLHTINNDVKKGIWTKIPGNSLSNKKACIIGFGDIGQSLARKLLAFNINVFASDPYYYSDKNKVINVNSNQEINLPVTIGTLDTCLENANYIFVCCSLNKHTRNILHKGNIQTATNGCIIINVARGGIVNERDVVELLNNGHISCIGFDVFEEEPVSVDNLLLSHERSIFTSHNSSNTYEAVNNVNTKCIEVMLQRLQYQ